MFRQTLIATAIAALATGSAFAAVSADEAKQLGSTLTAIGGVGACGAALEATWAIAAAEASNAAPPIKCFLISTASSQKERRSINKLKLYPC